MVKETKIFESPKEGLKKNRELFQNSNFKMLYNFYEGAGTFICFRRIRRQWTNFTLIELLVVIAIITILTSMLLPALKKARGVTQRTYCANQLKQNGLAFAQYTGDYNEFLPLARIDGDPWPSWYNYLAPYMGEDTNGNYFNFVECPSDPYVWLKPDGTGRHTWVSSYGINRNIYLGDYDIYPPLSKIQNPSQKIYVGDGRHAQEGSTLYHTHLLYSNDPLRSLYRRHDNGANVLWLDWHVEFRTDLDNLTSGAASVVERHWYANPSNSY